jgi:hypothetical protein
MKEIVFDDLLKMLHNLCPMAEDRIAMKEFRATVIPLGKVIES